MINITWRVVNQENETNPTLKMTFLDFALKKYMVLLTSQCLCQVLKEHGKILGKKKVREL